MNKKIVKPIVIGVIINVLFLLTEIIFQYLGVFDETVRLYVVDEILRLTFGIAALIGINYCYKNEMSEHSLKEYFTHKIPKATWLYISPFAAYLIIQIVMCFFANAYTLRLLWLFPINALQQVLTGWFEESVRVLILCGMLKYMCDTGKGRVKTILISGALFGLSHALNFFFGNDALGTLAQVVSCATWGFFMASIFLISRNLTLLMIMHAVWHIIVRIDDFFFGFPEECLPLDILNIIGTIIEYAGLIFVAFYIAVKYEKIVNRSQNAS